MKPEEDVRALLRTLSHDNLTYHLTRLKRSRRKFFDYGLSGTVVRVERKSARAMAEGVLGETP
jgi:hypothetical protein